MRALSLWKVVLPPVAFLLAVLAFELGGVPRGYPEGSPSLLASCYFALSLFVMGGIDLGIPVGPGGFAEGLLWFAYFLCPVITASALIDTFLTFLYRGAWRVRFTRNHIVLAGCGKLALLFLAELRRRNPRMKVVVVDPETSNTSLLVARQRYQARLVCGDITDPEALIHARIDKARRLVALSQNDVANLSCLYVGRNLMPPTGKDRLVGHVSDLALLRTLKRRQLIDGIAAFNSYRIAAKNLVEESLLQKFRASKPPDRLLIVGFGRFGQTILAHLQASFGRELDEVFLIDRLASRNLRVFEEQVGLSAEFKTSVHNGDVRDPALWDEIKARLEGQPGPPPLILLCTEDRASNLELAIELSSRWPDARVVVRVLHVTDFEANLARENDIEVESVSELLSRSFPEAWFQ